MTRGRDGVLAPVRIGFVVGSLLAFGCKGADAPAPDQPGAPPPSAPPAGHVSTTTPPPAAASTTPPPLSGGTLTVLSDGKTAVASDPDRDQVYVVDLLGPSLTATIKLQPQDEPGRLVEDGQGRVHVALRSGGAVLTIDPKTGSVLARRALCPAPRGLAFDRASELLHVACAGGELVSIAPTAEAPARTLRLDRDLRDVVVSGSRLLVSTFRKAEVLMVGSTGMAGRLAPSAMPAVFESAFMKPLAPGSTGATMASPATAWRMVASANGRAVMMHQRGVDGSLSTKPGGYGNRNACAGIVEGTVTTVDPEPIEATRQVVSGAPLAGVVVPVDIALSPDGEHLAVVSAGHGGTQRQLQFFMMKDMGAARPPEQPCVPPTSVPVRGGAGGRDGGAPADAGPSGGGLGEPIEYRPPNGEVIGVAFDPRGNVIVQSREPATIQILTQRAAPVVLSNESRGNLGHRLFHTTTAGLIACASCHPEGGDDGRTWHFAEVGRRRTQSLRGGIADTAPFHWDGDMRNLGHLMTDVFQGRMGGAPIDDAGLGALASWMDRIPKIRPTVADGAAVARGKAVFESGSVGCMSCHSGPDLTNNLTVDVGTGRRLQVPQLHGLAFRAPYLHDGCASTLEDRFTKCGGGDQHGVTSKLTRDQLTDLITYLESL